MWGFGYVFVSGIIYVFTDRPEAAFAVPVLMALQNYLKHKQNITWL